jgi:hypothetical protein
MKHLTFKSAAHMAQKGFTRASLVQTGRICRRVFTIRVVCFLFAFHSCMWSSLSFAGPFTFDDIQYWIGSGTNRAALAIDWGENSTEPPALVWGYRWNGTAHGSDMLAAVVADDPRLFAKLGGSLASPVAVYGLGYDANDNHIFGIDDGTSFDSLGFAVTDPADLATATDSGDYYAEGWFAGFWHYGVAATDPFDGGSWSDIAQGMGSRTLSDGAWDSWTFSPTFNFASFAENPTPAEPPFVTGDFNRDGFVDASDYAMWRSDFGLTSRSNADANGNGLVDAADYVIWRKAAAGFESGSGVSPIGVPEPSTAWLLLCVLWRAVIFKRKADVS